VAYFSHSVERAWPGGCGQGTLPSSPMMVRHCIDADPSAELCGCSLLSEEGTKSSAVASTTMPSGVSLVYTLTITEQLLGQR
jgi:hypothetical protein